MTLPSPKFPEASLNMAISPKAKGDEDKIMPALQKLMEEDPVLKVYRDEQTGEFIISGLGQLHIELRVDRLKRRYNVEVELKPPRSVQRPSRPPPGAEQIQKQTEKERRCAGEFIAQGGEGFELAPSWAA